MSDVSHLITDLKSILPESQVLSDRETLQASSHDTWPLSTKLRRLGCHDYQADVVVKVTDEKQIQQVLALATANDTPVTPRALASSVTGQPLPTRGGIVLDVTGMTQHREINITNLTVEVSAGYNGGQLEDELQQMGWTLGHSPQSLYQSTVGGWLSTLATGQFSSYYGGIEELVTAYTVILATGEKLRLKASPRAAMGPDLRQLFIGAEGTLGIVTSVQLKIFPLPQTRLYDSLELPSIDAGLEIMREQAMAGLRPFLLRLYDTNEARHAMQNPLQDKPVMFLGTQGVDAVAHAEMDAFMAIVHRHGGKSIGSEGVLKWMERRFDFSTVEKLLDSHGGFAETIEIAHTWDGISGLYHALHEMLTPLADEVLSHFSHVYAQGTSMYMILLGRESSDREAVEKLRTIWRETMRVCLEHHAELSHHHGGGLVRSPYARESLGSAHLLLRRVKQALDPNGTLNPGKLGL
ncbi:TPA: FAD-binding oxidoreductase [Raoultella ornithinolytica]|uniref:FAD-binding oxidoreductase n=1 Tax=Raoultella ornithinolytica TaxID=54291 RepID=UPI0004D6B00E|nr:FAD-binding oxidoreductase [Raoultella ornithinolytica]EJD6310342.1 FAD-binding oxidoreductase [Raoultella ornithinolytica]KDV94176.1 FAD binding domain protein [Raoultella ornithinolytica 2-156-04_S1_C1]KDX14405.1 FAD binding domain protein [Raoultella ornithinolytica 2-156-04_S1_C2]MEB7897500.1 FAD-binding oxidoreductase [Raoultella ornithinolytica]PQH22723.1 FAD-binding oxidoreductase [Raoultella ornithinolytica]